MVTDVELRPNPQNIRDLRLMYDTASKVDGTIEYKRLWPKVMSSRDYHEGDITGMYLRVVPSNYRDLVTVCVQREQVTNLREGGVYSPKRLIDWSKEYTFQEFKESPFYQMCIDVWSDRSGLATKLYWDTHLMDEHEVFDDGTRWGVYAHVYEHRRTWLNNWDKTGRIEAVDFSLDEDGNIELGLSRNGKRECFYDGDVWTLADIIDEHEQMQEQLAKLKEHSIDLNELLAENAKLRELLQRLLTEYRYMRVRPRAVYLQHEERMRAIEEEMRELGIEVES